MLDKRRKILVELLLKILIMIAVNAVAVIVFCHQMKGFDLLIQSEMSSFLLFSILLDKQKIK